MSNCGSLTTNTTGQSNTAVGYQALFNNTTGQHNTANSSQALNSNTTGIRTLPWFSDGIGPIDEFTYSSPADTGSNFRIDSFQYVYNLSTSALGVGAYRVEIKTGGIIVA